MSDKEIKFTEDDLYCGEAPTFPSVTGFPLNLYHSESILAMPDGLDAVKAILQKKIEKSFALDKDLSRLKNLSVTTFTGRQENVERLRGVVYIQKCGTEPDNASPFSVLYYNNSHASLSEVAASFAHYPKVSAPYVLRWYKFKHQSLLGRLYGFKALRSDVQLYYVIEKTPEEMKKEEEEAKALAAEKKKEKAKKAREAKRKRADDDKKEKSKPAPKTSSKKKSRKLEDDEVAVEEEEEEGEGEGEEEDEEDDKTDEEPDEVKKGKKPKRLAGMRERIMKHKSAQSPPSTSKEKKMAMSATEYFRKMSEDSFFPKSVKPKKARKLDEMSEDEEEEDEEEGGENQHEYDFEDGFVVPDEEEEEEEGEEEEEDEVDEAEPDYPEDEEEEEKETKAAPKSVIDSFFTKRKPDANGRTSASKKQKTEKAQNGVEVDDGDSKQGSGVSSKAPKQKGVAKSLSKTGDDETNKKTKSAEEALSKKRGIMPLFKKKEKKNPADVTLEDFYAWYNKNPAQWVYPEESDDADEESTQKEAKEWVENALNWAKSLSGIDLFSLLKFSYSKDAKLVGPAVENFLLDWEKLPEIQNASGEFSEDQVEALKDIPKRMHQLFEEYVK